MKVCIGKYRHRIDLDDWIPLPESHPWFDSISVWLWKTPLARLINWLNRYPRTTLVWDITSSDTYSLDSTLATIILPCLKKFRDEIDEYPCVFNENPDIPEELADADNLTKWQYLVDEMIYAFEQFLYSTDFDLGMSEESLELYEQRIQRGFELFGKYYRALWRT